MLPGQFCCSNTSTFSGLASVFSGQNIWLVVKRLQVFRHWMSQLDCPVVQDHARTDDLACLGWSYTQLSVETVPPALENSNASFDGASSTAMCCVVCRLLLALGVDYWCHQPLA